MAIVINFKCMQAEENPEGTVMNITLVPTTQANADVTPNGDNGLIEFELRNQLDFPTYVVGQSYDIDIAPVVP